MKNQKLLLSSGSLRPNPCPGRRVDGGRGGIPPEEATEEHRGPQVKEANHFCSFIFFLKCKIEKPVFLSNLDPAARRRAPLPRPPPSMKTPSTAPSTPRSSTSARPVGQAHNKFPVLNSSHYQGSTTWPPWAGWRSGGGSRWRRGGGRWRGRGGGSMFWSEGGSRWRSGAGRQSLRPG